MVELVSTSSKYEPQSVNDGQETDDGRPYRMMGKFDLILLSLDLLNVNPDVMSAAKPAGYANGLM